MSDLQILLRRHRVLLVLAALVGALSAFAYASTVKPTYDATASLQFQDITLLEGFVGTPAATLQTPAELAAASARTVKTGQVLSAAKSALGTSKSINSLRASVTASVDTASNLVLVVAKDHDAAFSARFANAVAAAAADATNRATRSVFKNNARELQIQIRGTPKSAANLITVQNEQANLARLQTLSIVARPAQVIQPADVPTSPASPKPVFDTILGGVLGLIIGGGIMLMRERLDRTVRSAEEISEVMQIPVLAEVPESVMGTAPFVDGGDTKDSRLVMTRFGMLRRGVELVSLEQSPRVIAVISGGAQEGKTTVALSLACAFVSVGRRTVLVECDLRRPALAARLNLPSEPGLAEYLAHQLDPQEIVRSVPLKARSEMTNNGSEATPALACIVAGAMTNDPDEMLASSAFKRVIHELSDAYDTVIVDTPPLLPVPDTLEILPLVDARVVCVRAHRSRKAELAALRATLDRLPSKPTVGVITGWTRADIRAAAAYYGYQDYYGAPTQAVTPEA